VFLGALGGRFGFLGLWLQPLPIPILRNYLRVLAYRRFLLFFAWVHGWRPPSFRAVNNSSTKLRAMCLPEGVRSPLFFFSKFPPTFFFLIPPPPLSFHPPEVVVSSRCFFFVGGFSGFLLSPRIFSATTRSELSYHPLSWDPLNSLSLILRAFRRRFRPFPDKHA